MTASADRNGSSTRWPSPVPCPRLPFDHSARPAEFGGDGTHEDIDALEAAALMNAFDEGYAALRDALPRIDDAAGRVEDDFQRAGSAIDSLARLRDTRRVEEAAARHAAVLARHANDGPEDRRRRIFRPWMVWVVLLAAAVFDAAFVGNLMQRILGVGPGDPLYYLAYLPGVGMALCLLAAGTVLAENLYRRRLWLTRRPRRDRLNPWLVVRRAAWWWREERQERRPDELPWFRITVPLVFAGLTVGLLGVIAYIRALQAGALFADLRDLQPAFVVLLLLLSISAIAVKVLAHNPCADSSEAATKGLTRMSSQVERSTTTARSAVADAVKSANRLVTTIINAESEARSTVERACAQMMVQRGRRDRAGNIALPLVYLRWPTDGTAIGGTELPGLDLTLLDRARKISDRYQPEMLKVRLARTVHEINQQFHRDNATAPDITDSRPPAW